MVDLDSFIREGEDGKATSWEDALAMKYESNLFKEFAVCDLKHYKTGNVSHLRLPSAAMRLYAQFQSPLLTASSSNPTHPR